MSDPLDLDAILAAADPMTPEAWTQQMRDDAFILHARVDVPALVAEVRALRAREETAVQSMPLGDLALAAVVERAEKAEAGVRALRAQVERLTTEADMSAEQLEVVDGLRPSPHASLCVCTECDARDAEARP